MSPSSVEEKSIGTGTTKISERMTWKQLQLRVREKNDDFSQLLAQNFLLLHQQARDKKDGTSMQTLVVIVAGLIDLTKAIEERTAAPATYARFYRSGLYALFPFG